MSVPFRNKMPKRKFKFAKKLRERATKSEEILLQELKGKKLGVKFRFQQPMLGWIVDFWCPEKKLVIELDGGFHQTDEQRSLDKYKDKVISEHLKANILRIPSSKIFTDLQGCLEQIKSYLK